MTEAELLEAATLVRDLCREIDRLKSENERLEIRLNSMQIDRNALFAANRGLLEVNESLRAALGEERP